MKRRLRKVGDILSPMEQQGGVSGGWGSSAATGHTAGQTADDAVKGSAARTDRRCSPNKAFIARMCVHDPKESRFTAVPATFKELSRTACCLSRISGSDMTQTWSQRDESL